MLLISLGEPKLVKMSIFWKVESEKSQAMAEAGLAASTEDKMCLRRRTPSFICFSWTDLWGEVTV